MNYSITDFHKIELDKFREEISNQAIFEISFPLSSIGSSNSRIDIINDYSEVSYCSEKIAQFVEILESGLVTRDKYYTDFKIKCKAIDIENLYKELYYISEIKSDGTDNFDDIDKITFWDNISDYEESYKKRIFIFPELINNYWANLINGAYWEIASEYYESENEFFNKTYRKYPEHRFGFWKSPISTMFNETIYFSTENWIIPPNTNLIQALKIYSGLNRDLIIEEADSVLYNDSTILISNSNAVYFNQKPQLINSIKCTELVLNKIHNKTKISKIEFEEINSIQTTLFGEKSTFKKIRKRINYNDDIHIDETKLIFKISEFGDLIIVEYNEYSYIFFSNNTLNFEELKGLNSFLFPAYAKTQNLIDISISENCNWSEIDDDTFEELCYDILYGHPHFESSTIQKMGKSRSRDGGRDIAIKTKKTPTNEQELFIFQCKYFSEKTSLSASKISNAGNVIMQYGAKGYGVFTTTVIDSTLYDMLDGFNRNLNIDTSFCWSKYELERYLNRHQLIKNKYFKK